MIRFILVQNRQGKTRLAKWYVNYEEDERQKLKSEIHKLVSLRDQKSQSNFAEFQNYQIVYRRYAGLFFSFCVDASDNQMAYLEAIHVFVEILDEFFELKRYCCLLMPDKVYSILDEVFLAGELQETNKRTVINRLAHLDKLE